MSGNGIISRLKSSAGDSGSKRILIGAGVLIVGAIAYSAFSTPDPVANPSTVVPVPDKPTVQGGGVVTPAYNDALKTADQQRIAEAIKEGKSAIPTVVGNPQQPKIPELLLDPVEEPPPPVELPVIKAPEIVQKPLTPAAPIVSPQPVRNTGDTRNLQDYMLGLRRGYAVAEVVTLSNGEIATHQEEQTPPAVTAAGHGGAGEAASKVTLPLAGTILYAQMVSRANSDAPGPVLARILQGEYAGATLIGSFETVQNALVISFDKMTVTTTRDGTEVNETVPINTVAVDTAHIGTALATKVDRHLFQKLAIGFTASFAEGFGSALANNGRTRIVTEGGTTIETSSELDTDQQLMAAGGQAVSEAGNILMDEFGRRPTTVIVESGTPIGILFL